MKTRYLAALSPATDQWVIPVLCTAVNAFGTIPVVVLFLGGLVVAAWIIELKTILAATQFEERQRVAEDATESEKKGAAP